MKVIGIDFTSCPTRRKPLTCVQSILKKRVLRAHVLTKYHEFDEFESALNASGPWIAGIDFPFGQSRKLITNICWPQTWGGYVAYAGGLGAVAFYSALTAYRNSRPYGCKEHQRETDRAAGSISPQKLYGVPVGRMFFQGAPRLLRAGVTIPGLQAGDPNRIVVEAYPKILARKFGNGNSYKSDNKKKQTEEQHRVRREILRKVTDDACLADYGLHVEGLEPLQEELAADPTGDKLDALLCAIQAAWSWTQREAAFGAPPNLDPLEGWIADPSLRSE